jgi:protein-S-isoprenylcysteine O-methyltransferase Ste14
MAAWLLGLGFPLPMTPSLGVRVVGGLILASGLLLDLSAMVVMRRAHTNILPHRGADALVVSGPFRFTRNPIYLGNTVVMIGVAFMLANAWFLLSALVAAVLVDRLAIRREERHLAQRFGESWRDYAAHTARWLLK